MLKKRLWAGALMACFGLGVLVVDHAFAPHYPILLVVVLGVGLLATYETRQLLPAAHRPLAWLTFPAVVVLIISPWFAPDHQLAMLAAFVMAAFVAEVAIFRSDGTSTPRIAATILILGYLGILGGSLGRLRFLDGPTPTIFGHEFSPGALALASAFFVPKVGDIGAYTFGHAFGRHKFAPTISPKKTWEGAVGGLLASVAIAFVLCGLTPLFDGRWAFALALGAAIAVAGQLGDLAESILKRDGQTKDASQTIPGFGGVLDVVDSILFAAPVTLAGFWLANL